MLLLLTGHDPIEVYRLIIERGLLDRDGLTESLKRMAPLLIISAGLIVCVRAGIWNIGIDGQVVFGAIVCGALAGEMVGSAPRRSCWSSARLSGQRRADSGRWGRPCSRCGMG